MVHGILQAALAEERRLLARLELVRSVIREYGDMTSDQYDPVDVPRNHDNDKRSRARSDKTQRVMSLLKKRLDGVQEPIPTRDLLAFVEREGIHLGGKNSIATLSAMLSRATEFEPVGKRGWRLKSRTPDADTSGAAFTGGDTPPLFESHGQEPNG